MLRAFLRGVVALVASSGLMLMAPSPAQSSREELATLSFATQIDPAGGLGLTPILPMPVAPPTPPKPKRLPAPPSVPAPDPWKTVEDEVIRLTNIERGKAGCEPLRTDERLRIAARNHSADMARRDYFAHLSQDGRTYFQRVKAAGYPRPAGENLARGQDSSQEVVQAWMDSPGHRRNMLSCEFDTIGVGVRRDSEGKLYWSQEFGFSGH